MGAGHDVMGVGHGYDVIPLQHAHRHSHNTPTVIPTTRPPSFLQRAHRHSCSAPTSFPRRRESGTIVRVPRATWGHTHRLTCAILTASRARGAFAGS